MIAPTTFAALFSGFCVGVAALALALHPDDPVARWAAVGSLPVSGLVTAAVFRGLLKPRLKDNTSSVFTWQWVVCMFTYFMVTWLIDRRHGLSRNAAGLDASGVALLLTSLITVQMRRRR
ncbi:MAG: hypothetical protein M3Z02_12115 [Actinomycetota bacterium]|nr:hypothetical protein [Actinomycetota bacterium]